MDLGVLEEIGPKITRGTRGYRTTGATEPQGGTGGTSHRAERVAWASNLQSLKPSNPHSITSSKARRHQYEQINLP